MAQRTHVRNGEPYRFHLEGRPGRPESQENWIEVSILDGLLIVRGCDSLAVTPWSSDVIEVGLK